MAARGCGLLRLLKLKNPFPLKCLIRIQNDLTEMFIWWPSTKIAKLNLMGRKTWPTEGGASSLMYLHVF